jgi:hypothetical protein
MTKSQKTLKPSGERPSVGAIRWDVWSGGDVTRQVEKTLGPLKYQARLLWFAQVNGAAERPGPYSSMDSSRPSGNSSGV